MIPGFDQMPEGQIIAFALVLLRLLAFFFASPIIGTQNVPIPVKILLSIVLAVVLFPIVSFQNVDMIRISDDVLFLAIRELFIGLFLGFLMRSFFFAISVAGEIISVSMGLGAAQVFNPTLGSQSNVIEQFQVAIATLFFFSLNGHHWFIQGMATSFELAPVSALAVKYQGFAMISNVIQDVVLIGLKISAPILISMFLANVAMGVVGRAVPQINVLVTSLPVQILLGLAVLLVCIPLFIGEMNGLIDVMANQMIAAMKVL